MDTRVDRGGFEFSDKSKSNQGGGKVVNLKHSREDSQAKRCLDLMRNLEACVLACDKGDQGCADTAAILGDADADLLVAGDTNLGDLAQSLTHVSFKVGVELNQTAVNTNVNDVVGSQLVGRGDDSGQGDGAQTSSTLADGVDQNLDGLALLEAGVLNLEVILQCSLDIHQVLAAVSFNGAEQAGVKTPLAEEHRPLRNGDLGVLVRLEQSQLGVVVKRQKGTTQDFAQEHAGNTLLKHLHTGVVAVGIKLVIKYGSRENAHVVVKATPLGVDDHLSGRVVKVGILHVLELSDVLGLLNVGTVGAGSEDSTEESTSLARGGI